MWVYASCLWMCMHWRLWHNASTIPFTKLAHLIVSTCMFTKDDRRYSPFFNLAVTVRLQTPCSLVGHVVFGRKDKVKSPPTWLPIWGSLNSLSPWIYHPEAQVNKGSSLRSAATIHRVLTPAGRSWKTRWRSNSIAMCLWVGVGGVGRGQEVW